MPLRVSLAVEPGRVRITLSAERLPFAFQFPASVKDVCITSSDNEYVPVTVNHDHRCVHQSETATEASAVLASVTAVYDTKAGVLQLANSGVEFAVDRIEVGLAPRHNKVRGVWRLTFPEQLVVAETLSLPLYTIGAGEVRYFRGTGIVLSGAYAVASHPYGGSVSVGVAASGKIGTLTPVDRNGYTWIPLSQHSEIKCTMTAAGGQLTRGASKDVVKIYSVNGSYLHDW